MAFNDRTILCDICGQSIPPGTPRYLETLDGLLVSPTTVRRLCVVALHTGRGTDCFYRYAIRLFFSPNLN